MRCVGLCHFLLPVYSGTPLNRLPSTADTHDTCDCPDRISIGLNNPSVKKHPFITDLAKFLVPMVSVLEGFHCNRSGQADGNDAMAHKESRMYETSSLMHVDTWDVNSEGMRE